MLKQKSIIFGSCVTRFMQVPLQVNVGQRAPSVCQMWLFWYCDSEDSNGYEELMWGIGTERSST